MMFDTNGEKGFTLIEVMVTMVIALVILAGMSSLFISQTKTAQVLNQKSEVMNDLFLASQIMQQELRGAKAICWESGSSNKRIRYQPLSSPNGTPAEVSANKLTSACTKNSVRNGFFQIRPKNNTSKPTPYICWDRQGGNVPQIRCEEMLRGMKANVGMTISPTDNATAKGLQAVRTITLTAQYQDRDHNTKDLSLSFKVWPRNTQ